MNINKHLIKKGPLYKIKNRDYLVKIIRYSARRYDLVNCQIMTGESKGKFTNTYNYCLIKPKLSVLFEEK